MKHKIIVFILSLPLFLITKFTFADAETSVNIASNSTIPSSSFDEKMYNDDTSILKQTEFPLHDPIHENTSNIPNLTTENSVDSPIEVLKLEPKNELGGSQHQIENLKPFLGIND